MDEFESSDAPDAAEEAGEAEQADVAVEAPEAEEAEEFELPSLPSRLFNVFLSPGKVMEAIAQKPAWAGALLVGAFLVALQTALIPWDLMREMMIEAQRQAALEAGREVPEMPEAFMNIMRYVTPVFGVIGITLFTFFFAGIYWLIFSFVLGDEGRYRQYLAVGAHALFVPAVIGLALVPVKIMMEDVAMTLNLGNFLFFLPEGYLSNVFRAMDLTGMWSALIIAQGAHSIDPKRGFGSAAAVTLGVMSVMALIQAIFAP
jgi:hypothetical protein